MADTAALPAASLDTSNDAAIAAALAENEAAASAAAARASARPPADDDPTRGDAALAWALQESEKRGRAPAWGDGAWPGAAAAPAPWRAVLERVAASRLAAAPRRTHEPRAARPWAGDASADQARLRATLAAYGLRERKVRGDGACQFRALAHQLVGDEDACDAVRQAVVAQVRGEGRRRGWTEGQRRRPARHHPPSPPSSRPTLSSTPSSFPATTPRTWRRWRRPRRGGTT
jgi:hypothetical protein